MNRNYVGLGQQSRGDVALPDRETDDFATVG